MQDSSSNCTGLILIKHFLLQKRSDFTTVIFYRDRTIHPRNISIGQLLIGGPTPDDGGLTAQYEEYLNGTALLTVVVCESRDTPVKLKILQNSIDLICEVIMDAPATTESATTDQVTSVIIGAVKGGALGGDPTAATLIAVMSIAVLTLVFIGVMLYIWRRCRRGKKSSTDIQSCATPGHECTLTNTLSTPDPVTPQDPPNPQDTSHTELVTEPCR